MTPDDMNAYLKSLQVVPSAQASVMDKQVYSVKVAVIGLIEFVTTSLEQIGIDGFHEVTIQ